MKKTILAAAALIAIGAGTANAAYYGKITPRERHAISYSKAKLSHLKHRIYADGRVTFLEKVQLRIAQRRHANLVKRARRT